MSLTTIRGGVVFPPPPLGVQGAPSTGFYTLSVAGSYLALIFQAPRACNVRKLHWFVTGHRTTGDLDVTLEGVSAGAPNGTPIGPTASLTVGSAGWKTWDFGAGVNAVTRGQFLALVAKADATATPDLDLGVFGDATASGFGGLPYLYRSASSAPANFLPFAAIEDDAGGLLDAPGLVPAVATSTQQWDSAASPVLRGLKFRLPVPAKLVGCWLWTRLQSSDAGDAVVEAFDATGAPFGAAVKVTWPESASYTTLDHGVHYFRFTAPATLNRNTDYRLAIRPTGGNDVALSYFDAATSALLEGYPGGQNWHWTQTNVNPPTGTGDWTDTTTRRPWMGLVLDELDDGTAPATAAVLPPRRRIILPPPLARRRRDTIATFPPPPAVPIVVRSRRRIHVERQVVRRTRAADFDLTTINQTAIIAYSRKVR